MPPAEQTAATKPAQPQKTKENLNTPYKQGRQTGPSVKPALESIPLNRLSKVTATAKFKIFKPKRETVKPRHLEKIPLPFISRSTTYHSSQKNYQQQQQLEKMEEEELKAAISRSPSPGCGALPDCWSCGTELGDCPPCSCEECGMPN
ncbi:hypothetical protein MGYG_08105 [Nannizzia gypsea CBS 118893]|uniref:Uncharacterized protein n=1 Tax=Arthroderma gypseum (strain ATCC MYA-4604 / CBS 118893) TaxID=535722 RepID=E4V522_ARTGP|nr:hypothetical protein MGYG_08105 [Nannizzia gypsea CBS 118893]EFR05096.1 hypothetical protein MGYG_08105 [Nannizzia gypsea CBS 118893]